LPGKTGTHPGASVAELQYKNLRTAETEKYAHVTYFFNGGVEKPFAGEERILVPSPKVATYDLKPEMSAAGITGHGSEGRREGRVRRLIMNYANADMVGHFGKTGSGDQAGRSGDAGLARIYQALKPRGGVWRSLRTTATRRPGRSGHW